MDYELVITRTQPPCGGKSPQTHEIRSVSTEDVVAYVRPLRVGAARLRGTDPP